MLPLEFVVPGQPVSHQTNNRALLRVWRARVQTIARHHWPTDLPPLDSLLKLTVVYFHEDTSVRMDNDNMLKPIQDALIGIVYRDDRQITDSVVRRTARAGAFRVLNMPSVVADALAWQAEFVYLRIESAPDHREFV